MPASVEPSCTSCNGEATATTIFEDGSGAGQIITAPLPNESLYQPDTVFEGTVYTEKPVYEIVPTPAISPELGRSS